MSCNCAPEKKRTYFANIELFTDLNDGMPTGASPHLDLTEVVVCSHCGKAEFSIPASHLRTFQAA
jgi:hypothetical protein